MTLAFASGKGSKKDKFEPRTLSISFKREGDLYFGRRKLIARTTQQPASRWKSRPIRLNIRQTVSVQNPDFGSIEMFELSFQ